MNSLDPKIAQLQERLQNLEKELRNMLDRSQNDLKLARLLQSQLMPNRLPELTGLQTLARYISSRELSSESFDLITTHNNRELWMIHTWTSNFGLSAVLMQTLVHLKSKDLIRTSTSPETHVVFDQIIDAIGEAQKKGSYRILIAKLDLNNLTLTGTSIGQAPVLLRNYEKGVLGDFTFVKPEALIKQPQLLEKAKSSDPMSSFKAHQFEHTLNAGSRFFIIGREWNAEAPLEEFAAPLSLNTLKESFESNKEDSLLSNLNSLVIKIEDHLKHQNKKSDITALAFEINPKLLHLA